MTITRASALLVGISLTMPAFAADWQPASTPFRIGKPAPLSTGNPPLSLSRPVPLGEGVDSGVRRVSYAPALQPPEPIFRGKVEIPRIIPRSSLGLLPVLQTEPPEAGAPRSEDIPLMPKQSSSGLETVPPTEPFQPLPDNLQMPYADGSVSTDGGIIAYPENATPGDGWIDCGCEPNDCCCEPCCCASCCSMKCWTICLPCWNWCGGCCDCYPRPHAWVSGEYLLLNFDRQSVPPLLTTSNQDDNGLLGAASTKVLYGEDQLNDNNWHSGLRVSAGFWFRNNACWGMDASGFLIFRDTNTFSAASGGAPLLARPYFNLDGSPNSVLLAKTGVVRGTIAIRDDARLWGYDVNLRRKWCCGCNHHLDLVLGYRQLQLEEGIEIDDFEADAAEDFTAIAFDRFRTRNSFYGGQIGFDGECRLGPCWSLAGSLKVGLGVVRQQVSIVGFTDLTDNTIPAQGVGKGGILALASNIGQHQQSRFAVSPELQLKLQYHLNENCRVFVGYNLLMISSVVRPGEQIDLTLDDTQFPSLPNNLSPAAGSRPAVLFRTSPFVAQGVSFGLLCNY